MLHSQYLLLHTVKFVNILVAFYSPEMNEPECLVVVSMQLSVLIVASVCLF